MLLHVVLFKPKSGVSEADRTAIFDALHTASSEIPSVRRFRIGTRVTHGGKYEGLMSVDYSYSALIEFDDLSGLKAYLSHRSHERLGELFYALSDTTLVYDYETTDLTVGGRDTP
jgi:Stress responsive A/B Barrel Domain